MADKYADGDIQRLRQKVLDLLSWGSPDSWHSNMFQELSEKIFGTTNIMLSVATLKRFFGVVNHDGRPSITTLDALSLFVGAKNWRTFKLSNSTNPRKNYRIHGKSIYITIGFVLAFLIVIIIGNKRPEITINPAEFSFSSQVLSRTYPNSVVFKFNIPETLNTDSLHIQQYWDETKTVSITKDQQEATGIYYFPGYFRAKLMVEGKSVMEHDLFLKSHGWIGTLEYRPVPKYFDPIISERHGLTIPEVISQEVKGSDQPLISAFHYIDDLGNVSGDNFTFSTTIQNKFDDRWAVCQSVRIYFIGSDGAMIIPFSKIGCSSDNNLMLNDVYLRGKSNDLSALNADFTEPTKIEISVKNKQVNMLVDNREVYSLGYNDTMGRLVGARLKFQGLGEVQDIQLLDQNDRNILLGSGGS